MAVHDPALGDVALDHRAPAAQLHDALGALPGLPKVAVHWPLIDFESGPDKGADTFIENFFKAERGELAPGIVPRQAGHALTAMMDGLQVQWLYDNSLSMADELLHFVNNLLVEPL